MKRGMIIIEVFSILGLALLGIVFLVLIYMTLADDQTLIEESVADLQDNRAHMVLHNLLLIPLENPPADMHGVVQEMTLYDLLALFEYDSNEERDERYQELFEQEFMRFVQRSDTSTHVLLFLMDMNEDRFISREKKPGDITYSWTNKCKDKEQMSKLSKVFVEGSYSPIYQTTMMVPGPHSPQKLEFQYCWLKK